MGRKKKVVKQDKKAEFEDDLIKLLGKYGYVFKQPIISIDVETEVGSLPIITVVTNIRRK